VTHVHPVFVDRNISSGNPPKPAILQVSLGIGQENDLELALPVAEAIQLREALAVTLQSLGYR
jgi:hypothetical protein